ncbi:hypothetical protein DPX16_23249 [Anabarilius grahami]|uniref:Coiled-coil domain-containing protein 106 n=1 Tax=Anabarilius grahami TaxID=495550 RepID=A0A3N0XHL6_ANAGA|nr:hypothetical protein DPX16_23249 [Anabarilius grahami]
MERRNPRKRARPQHLIDENDKEASAPPAPTQQVSLIKLKEENSFLKSKIKVLEDKCRDLENERDFLRSSLTNALSTKEEMQGASSRPPQNVIGNPDSSDEDSSDLHENKTVKRKRKEKKKKASKVNSSSSSDESISTSDSSVSSSPPKKRKHKKKSRKPAKHMKKNKRVFLPEEAIQRYKKVLQYLTQGMTKTLSYHKCGVDRKTIVDTAAIAELEYCDAEAYKTLREKFHRGQKLSEFAKQCKEMCTREPLRSIIEEKKKNGMLIDLCQKKIT